MHEEAMTMPSAPSASNNFAVEDATRRHQPARVGNYPDYYFAVCAPLARTWGARRSATGELQTGREPTPSRVPAW
jgi:hypothetical protein